MIGQGKTVHQAEIDATCELIDFLKYGVNSAMVCMIVRVCTFVLWACSRMGIVSMHYNGGI